MRTDGRLCGGTRNRRIGAAVVRARTVFKGIREAQGTAARVRYAFHKAVIILRKVEILGGPFQGTIRLMQAGGFRTLLKIEYEFQPERYRLLVYRDGKHIFGRCNIDYDDGLVIEQMLAQFRRLSPDDLLFPPETQPVSAPVGMTRSAVNAVRAATKAAHGSVNS